MAEKPIEPIEKLFQTIGGGALTGLFGSVARLHAGEESKLIDVLAELLNAEHVPFIPHLGIGMRGGGGGRVHQAGRGLARG
ncbi:hypothetical protein E1264_18045 [Actinomadura sp. KC216]|uniref:hypothetical protein n=1 Tax=Actinomadura sp. KC216 TaxID=2530370 RepID=UPI001053C434|nr:hypothetical protein [Actinomadura sp. KC216]TDB86406.1 hypothetical protein E1264_18045 [Actinomadura sp. KC216]